MMLKVTVVAHLSTEKEQREGQCHFPHSPQPTHRGLFFFRSVTKRIALLYDAESYSGCSFINSFFFFFRLPSCRTNVRKFSLRFQGPKIFNSINEEIKNSLSLREFTSKLKSTFLD